MTSQKTPPKGRNYPFPSRHSMMWETCHVTFDQAVEMFFDQTAMQQHLGHDPLIYNRVYKKVTYPTIQDAQRAHTEQSLAFYQKKEQEQLALEARGIKAFKNMNDAIRGRLNPTEDGVANPLERPLKPMGEISSMDVLERLLSPQQSAPSSSAASSNAPTVDPKNMYWPPYDFTAKDGEKQIEVIYRSNTAKIAVFTPEEWKKLFEQWDLYGDVKTVKDTATGLYDARQTARNLGGLGVTAIVKNIDGVEYLFLNNYDKFEQTILHGGIFRADNAQVVKMGLGALDSVKGMTRYVKVNALADFLVGSGINGLKYLLTDDYTLRELGVDEAKILVNAVSVATMAYVLGVVAGATLSAPVAGSVVVGLGILAIASGLVWGIDKMTDFQKTLIETVVDEFDEK